MKQVLQSLRDGKTLVTEVPVPAVRPGTALVRTAASLVSAGTERMVVEFAEKNLLGKAQSRPDLVRQLVDKARREGVFSTLEAAFNRLEQPMVLGYSSAGTIEAVGAGLHGFAVGDRVSCAGGGFAVHAEYAVVPQNLLVKLPDSVDFEAAAFTTLGAIALHGFRLAQPQLGERVAIIGLGLLGLLSVGIAKAAGCSVFGVDLSPERVELAQKMGAQAVLRAEAVSAGQTVSAGQGFDVVLICADARSNDPVELAGILARDRARVVAVGAVGLKLPRKVYYEKELTFLVSRSYGPGRYDQAYEERGQDYPMGYVRWTEGRNLAAFVDLLANGALDIRPLISHRFAVEDAPGAYELITGKKKEPFLGVLLTYTPASQPTRHIDLSAGQPAQVSGALGLGVLGAGNYASAVFLPNVVKAGQVQRIGIASGTGLSARHAAQRYGFAYASSDEREVLGDERVQIAAVLTRHNHHARQVFEALRAGKHVFCEKPLALTDAELDEISAALAQPGAPLLMVGFNRRFAPFAVQLKTFLQGAGEPLSAHYRVNAGYLPPNHWLHDPAQGGGRIIGEACHFIDFLSFLVGSAPQKVQAQALPDGARYRRGDNALLTLTYPDGSIGSVWYSSNGDKSLPKERVEVFCNGRVGLLDDFRHLELIRDGHRQVHANRFGQDKGHLAAWQAFLSAIQHGEQPPIAYDQLLGVSRAAIRAAQQLAGAE